VTRGLKERLPDPLLCQDGVPRPAGTGAVLTMDATDATDVGGDAVDEVLLTPCSAVLLSATRDLPPSAAGSKGTASLMPPELRHVLH
jgi:hypothetical protein